MIQRVAEAARFALVALTFLAPLASHLALASGWGLDAALTLAALQALGVGALLWSVLRPGWRDWAAPGASAALWLALGLGALHSPADGLSAMAGALHGLLYAGLLWLFGHTLAPGAVPLVTRIAMRINPWYHDGMQWYTRAVNVAWCAFFAGQLVASAALLGLKPTWWRFFVSTLHAPLVVAMAAAEYAVRQRCFPGESAISVKDTLRGLRRTDL